MDTRIIHTMYNAKRPEVSDNLRRAIDETADILNGIDINLKFKIYDVLKKLSQEEYWNGRTDGNIK